MSLLCLLTAGFGGERYGRTLPAVSGRIHKSIQLQMHAVLDLSAHSCPQRQSVRSLRTTLSIGLRVWGQTGGGDASSCPPPRLRQSQHHARLGDLTYHHAQPRASLSKGEKTRWQPRVSGSPFTSEHGDALCGHCLGAIPCVFRLSSRPCCTVPTIFNHTPFYACLAPNFNGECAFLRLFSALSLNETLSQSVRQGHNA